MTQERQRELEGLLSEHGAFLRTIVQELLTAIQEAQAEISQFRNVLSVTHSRVVELEQRLCEAEDDE